MIITIKRNYLKLEVDTETRKAGFFQINQDNQEALNEAQLGSEFSDTAYFDRKCEEGISALVDILHKFIVSCNEETADNDGTANNALPSNLKTWVLTLTFDGRRSIVPSTLANLCHKFIVYNMLYSWAVMAYPALVGEYREQRRIVQLDIQRIVYRKEPPVLEEEDVNNSPTTLPQSEETGGESNLTNNTEEPGEPGEPAEPSEPPTQEL